MDKSRNRKKITLHLIKGVTMKRGILSGFDSDIPTEI